MGKNKAVLKRKLQIAASKTVQKIIPINDRMVATMAGGAADCQFWTRVVAKYCRWVSRKT